MIKIPAENMHKVPTPVALKLINPFLIKMEELPHTRERIIDKNHANKG